MEIAFTSPKVRAGGRYHGEITRYTTNGDQTALYVFVTLDDEPEQEYMQYFKLDMGIHSHLAEFCNEMCIITRGLTVELDDMLGRRVVVRIGRFKDRLYVSKIWLDEDCYDVYVEDEVEEDE